MSAAPRACGGSPTALPTRCARTRRSALGATPARLAALVVGQGLGLTAIGIALGVLAAAGATQAIVSLLFGIEPFDLVTYAGVVALLLGVAFVACYAPAARASRVDPAITLRAD